MSGFSQNTLLELVPQTEFGLVRRASSGDTSAFKQLFDSHMPRVYGFCLRISADKDLADDLAQTVFIKAWEKLGSFKFESKFTTWLHSIAMNEFLSHRRSGNNFMKKITELFNHHERHSKYASRFDAGIDIESALSGLSEQARMVVVMHDIEGYKHEEISAMLGIAVGTSKAALHRARKQLRKELRK